MSTVDFVVNFKNTNGPHQDNYIGEVCFGKLDGLATHRPELLQNTIESITYYPKINPWIADHIAQYYLLILSNTFPELNGVTPFTLRTKGITIPTTRPGNYINAVFRYVRFLMDSPWIIGAILCAEYDYKKLAGSTLMGAPTYSSSRFAVVYGPHFGFIFKSYEFFPYGDSLTVNRMAIENMKYGNYNHLILPATVAKNFFLYKFNWGGAHPNLPTPRVLVSGLKSIKTMEERLKKYVPYNKYKQFEYVDNRFARSPNSNIYSTTDYGQSVSELLFGEIGGKENYPLEELEKENKPTYYESSNYPLPKVSQAEMYHKFLPTAIKIFNGEQDKF